MLYVMNTNIPIVTKREKNDNIPFYNEAAEIYKSLFKRTFGYDTQLENYIQIYANFKSLLKDGFTRDQIIALIFCHYEWRGLDGKNENIYNNLKSRGFPLSWINSRCYEYQNYIERTITPAKWNDPEYMQKLVDRWSLKLLEEIDDM